MNKSVYDIIKRQNGEAFAQGIRRYDNGIFDVPNLPEIVKFAGRNPLPLLPFLESLKQVKIPEIETGKSPFELLTEAGYDAFYADTLEKQNQIDEQLINITALNSIIAEKDATILSLQNQLREVSKQIDEMTIEYRFSRVTVSVLLDSSFGFSLCDVSDFNTGRALKEIFSNFTTFQVYGVALEDNYNVNAGLANFFIVDRLPIQEGYADVELHLTFNGEEFNVDSLDDNTNYRYCSYFEFFYNANNEVSKVDIHTNFSLIEN